MKSNVKKIVTVSCLILMIVGEKREINNKIKIKKNRKHKVLVNLPNILQSKTVGEKSTEFEL